LLSLGGVFFVLGNLASEGCLRFPWPSIILSILLLLVVRRELSALDGGRELLHLNSERSANVVELKHFGVFEHLGEHF